ncbi:MAG: FAD-dependent oxidoreductase, partial [Anaerolineales bacterium]
PHGYYSRPGLAYYLTGEIPEEMLFPFQQSDFNQLRVRRIKARVVRIEPRSHQIELDGGKWVAYDRLLVATGASAVRPKIPGIELEGVVKLDNLEDARRILSLASFVAAGTQSTFSSSDRWRDHCPGTGRRAGGPACSNPLPAAWWALLEQRSGRNRIEDR